jgi:hypothetical protein
MGSDKECNIAELAKWMITKSNIKAAIQKIA